jgi:hypothetical protein
MSDVALALADIDRLAGNRIGTHDVACPWCGPARRSPSNQRRTVLRVWRVDPGFASYHCARCGESGYATEGRRRGRPVDPKAIARAKVEAEERERARLDRADVIWCGAIPIAGTAGADYLAGRGIILDDVPDHGGLRFHERCPWEQGTAPCVIARFTDIRTCKPLGIHRRPISGDKPMSLGPIGGGVIRLLPDEVVETGLVIGEGIETVLAAATRIEHRGTLLQPAWACGFAGALETFPVLTGIEALTILVDHDEPDQNGKFAGQHAAQQCAKRWLAVGREVEVLIPTASGADFNREFK